MPLNVDFDLHSPRTAYLSMDEHVTFIIQPNIESDTDDGTISVAW